MIPAFNVILAIRREGLGINQALALLMLASGPARVAEIMRAMDCNNNRIVSALLKVLMDRGLTRPRLFGRTVKYTITNKGREIANRITTMKSDTLYSALVDAESFAEYVTQQLDIPPRVEAEARKTLEICRKAKEQYDKEEQE